MSMDSTVAIVMTRPETVLADYARLLRIAKLPVAYDPTASSSLQLVLGPASGRNVPASACPPWQLEGVVRALQADGWPDHRLLATAPADTPRERGEAASWRRVLAGCGLADDLNPAADVPMLALSALYTSRRLGLSGTLLSLAGRLLTAAEMAALGDDPQLLVQAWTLAGRPPLQGGILDATVCGDGPGLGALMPVAVNVLLAGTDPVAVDAVAAGLTGFAPQTLPLVRALTEAGLGCGELSRIDLVGDVGAAADPLALSEARRWRSPASRAPSVRRWRRFWQARHDAGLQPWRLRRARQRYETMPWGRLHAEYRRQGYIGGGDA
jgi:hypothetical protein